VTSLTVESDFWDLFPDACIGMVGVHGIDNRVDDPEIEPMLQVEVERAANHLGDDEIGSHPAVAPWRSAYAAFGVKPSKYRSSIESLLRSAKAGRVRSINPLVDLYNLISLRHLLPCGGEDLTAIQGDIHLTRAAGNEPFVPLGGTENEPPPRGAVIYRDDAGVICSCWNWREADRTKLTESTTDALLVIEAVPPLTRQALQIACDDLAALVTRHLGGTSTVAILDRLHPETTTS
jgi:DNA/RNA-binding domain of Phe-tRNA-synthetase-like protein